MNILFIGDVFGKSGRRVLQKKLPNLIKEVEADLVIANVENICHGKGTRKKDIELLKSLGVHVFTGGNHTFDNKDIYNLLEDEDCVIRPSNYPKNVPGKGFCIYKKILVINLMGRVFIKEGFSSPFEEVDQILEETKNEDIEGVIIDFHAETTSEKSALFHYLNGKVSAVLGTHTHVQTADEQVSHLGTAFITDVGMTGPENSIIGMETETVMKKFLTALPSKFEPSENAAFISAVVLSLENGKSENIKRIKITE